MVKRACFVLLLLLAACSGPGHVQYDNDRCLIDGHEATLGEVETRQSAVAARSQARQPWFAVVTIVVVLVAGGSNAGKAMVLLRARKNDTGRPLSELRQVLKKFPQASSALRVREKKPLETLPGLAAVMATLEKELGAQGRLLVRYSGTEAKLRLLIEGPTEAIVRDGLARLEAAVRAELSVVD